MAKPRPVPCWPISSPMPVRGNLADPSYAIGGSIQGKDGVTIDGGHAGKGDVLVAEADESDGSFAKYHPEIAIVTNSEADHLDHYGTQENYRAAFVNHVQHAEKIGGDVRR